MYTIIDREAYRRFDKNKRIRLFNNLSGPRTAWLVGTRSEEGQENLAIFNSVIHIGANPPLIAFIMRPISVERHTYENIIESEYYSLNTVNAAFLSNAHKTSNKLPRNVSEFDHYDIESVYRNDFFAPFVKDASLSLAMKLVECIDIPINKTLMIIGEMQFIHIDQHLIHDDGHVNHSDHVMVSGLESYYSLKSLRRFKYE